MGNEYKLVTFPTIRDHKREMQTTLDGAPLSKSSAPGKYQKYVKSQEDLTPEEKEYLLDFYISNVAKAEQFNRMVKDLNQLVSRFSNETINKL